ncbi:hypothetical protein L3Q82_014547 [Scortum barcoo]|uniref:Uncharacterized protein n=1 Tax=Scortum barcoo TaxID=214431 RepID=A0ACB8VX87_9TELE|nr:hypothetical protein L3Q82_014547 [Scortum barcoo]
MVVKGAGEVQKCNPHSTTASVQVRERSVEQEDDGILHSRLLPVSKLQRVKSVVGLWPQVMEQQPFHGLHHVRQGNSKDMYKHVTGLNDYRPVALTPIVMKCFERLVMAHIKDCVDVTVDPHQYAYRKNRSTEDAISSVVHTALTHLENKDSYVRLLFVDFTSAFNTIIPQTLVQKLTTLGLSSTLCNWVLDFLTDRPQSVRIHDVSSSSISPQHRLPPGLCAEPPPVHPAHTRLLSDTSELSDREVHADDTAVVGRIANNDESDYRQEVEHLEGWCRQNNLCINVKKIQGDDRGLQKGQTPPLSPVHRRDCGGSGLQLQEAEARRAGELSPDLLLHRCVVESVLSSCIIVWHGSCSAAEKKALQRVVKAAQRTVGRSLPTTTDIYTSRCRKRASCIMKDPTHTAHALFVPLPSGRRLRSIKSSRTTRLRNSFFPEAEIWFVISE